MKVLNSNISLFTARLKVEDFNKLLYIYTLLYYNFSNYDYGSTNYKKNS